MCYTCFYMYVMCTYYMLHMYISARGKRPAYYTPTDTCTHQNLEHWKTRRMRPRVLSPQTLTIYAERVPTRT